MTAGDVAVLIVLALSALLAFARGFVREVLSVAAWIGAAVVTIWAFPKAQPFLREYVTVEMLADLATGGGIFIVTLILLSILAHMVAEAVHGSALNALDRSLGFLFGLARGALVVCVAYLLFLWLMPDPEEHPVWITEARSLPFVKMGSGMVLSLIPPDALSESMRQATEIRDFLDAAGALDGATVEDEIPPDPAPPATNGIAPAPDGGYNTGADRPTEGSIDDLIRKTEP